MAMRTLYEAYRKAPEANDASKVPVVTCVKVSPSKTKNGTHSVPDLQITGWAARPAEFDDPVGAVNSEAVAASSLPTDKPGRVKLGEKGKAKPTAPEF
jgi:hypothetical protein